MKAVIFDDEGALYKLHNTFSYCYIDEESYNYISSYIHAFLYDISGSNQVLTEEMMHNLASEMMHSISTRTTVIEDIIADAMKNYVRFIITSIVHNNRSHPLDLIHNNTPLSTYLLLKTSAHHDIMNIIAEHTPELLHTLHEQAISTMVSKIIDYIVYKLVICNTNKLTNITMELMGVLSHQLSGFTNKRVLNLEVTAAYKIMVVTT